jgi:hemerythrin-like domain-containing protein
VLTLQVKIEIRKIGLGIFRNRNNLIYWYQRSKEDVMSNMPPNRPNIALSLTMLHRVITRAVNVSRQNAKKFIQTGIQDENLREGFVRFVRTLSEVIRSHHLVEDELAFPYFRDKIADAPYPRLKMDHEKMIPILKSINLAVEKVKDPATEKTALKEIDTALGEFAPLWAPHIEIEEKFFSVEKLGRIMSLDEHIRMLANIAAFNQKNSGPAALVTPFILFNLPTGPREAMMGAMPSEVTQKLLPGPWKAEWEPMSPFLDL